MGRLRIASADLTQDCGSGTKRNSEKRTGAIPQVSNATSLGKPVSMTTLFIQMESKHVALRVLVVQGDIYFDALERPVNHGIEILVDELSAVEDQAGVISGCRGGSDMGECILVRVFG